MKSGTPLKRVNGTESVTNPYGFTGRVLDNESGLMYYRARYYDANVGRFINEDPIGLLGGINLYAYVLNDSVNAVDPDGLFKIPGTGKAIGWGLKRLAKKIGGKLGEKLGEWADFVDPELAYPPEQQEMEKDSGNDGIPDADDPDDTPKGPC